MSKKLAAETAGARAALARRRVLNEADQVPARIVDLTERRGWAPDPYEDDEAARAEALAPLLAADTAAIGLARLGRRWTQLSGTAKLDFVLGLPDPEATVHALACEEFVFLARDIGTADSAALLTLASPAQLQAVFDLDGWRRDALDTRRLARWLEVAARAGPDTLDRLVASQEAGVHAALLATVVRVYENRDEAEELAPEHEELFTSPDGAFQLSARSDAELLPAARLLIDSLYRIDLVHARKVLRAVRWELPATLEDDLHDLRDRRIARYGFVGRAEARRLYEFVDPDRVRERLSELLARAEAPRPDTARPIRVASSRTGLALRDWKGSSLLGRAVIAAGAAQQERLELAFTHLAYRVQAARAPGPADIDELPRWTRHALTTCDMGLRHLSGGDEARAIATLVHLPVAELFAAGHGLVVRLHHAARRLRARLGGVEGLALLESRDAGIVRALLRGLPEYALPDRGPALEDPEVARTRPFESLEELADARARIAELEAAAALVRRVAGRSAAEIVAELAPRLHAASADGVRLSSLVGTAIARAVIEGRPGLEPLTAAELRKLLSGLFEGAGAGRRVRDEIRGALSRALLASPDLGDDEAVVLDALLDTALARLGEELGGLPTGEPVDPRFLGTAVLVAGLGL